MKLIALFLLIGVVFSSPIEQRQTIPTGCTNITIPVSVYTSNNLILPHDLDPANFLLLYPQATVNGVLQAHKELRRAGFRLRIAPS